MEQSHPFGEPYGQPVNDLGNAALPEPGWPVGYAALMAQYGLRLPLPPRLAMATTRSRGREDDENWLIIRESRRPPNTLAGHVDFALRREGVDLAILNAVFQATSDDEIATVVRAAPTGRHTRRLWFLYEWLTGRVLDVPDAPKVKAVAVVDPTEQAAIENGAVSARHRVLNNLPGTPNFCPMVRWSPALRAYADRRLDVRARATVGRIHKDVLARAAAFMLLKDSRSSFIIEGEEPPQERVARWGHAIAQAGSTRLSVAELERLQRILVDDRFVELGLRREGGFVGDHDRRTAAPMPDHISARPEDLRVLLDGLVAYDTRALAGKVDPVVEAAVVAFGFIYMHPFVDGNGRLHRWLIHHVLAASGFAPTGVVFPISAVILQKLDRYRDVLEAYSRTLLPFINWRPTDSGNLEVLNDTRDYYRFFDATRHAEFLYECVQQTVERDLPEEAAFLEGYDRFARGVQEIVDMPSATVNLLHRFLQQGKGTLSNRARTNEFAKLDPESVVRIERLFAAVHASREPDERDERETPRGTPA